MATTASGSWLNTIRKLSTGSRTRSGSSATSVLEVAGQRFYPIQVDEKRVCWLRATFHGDGGHGALPQIDDATARMARFIDTLDSTRLPVHVVPTTKSMFTEMADALPLPTSILVRALLRPRLTNPVLDLMCEDGELFDALTHNVVNETVVRGGTKEHVVPASVSVTLDCRLLPGQTPDDVIDEIEAVVGDLAEYVSFELLRYEEGPSEPDLRRRFGRRVNYVDYVQGSHSVGAIH